MRERWHKSLSKLLGREFPSAVEEAADPRKADEVYNASVKLQIGRTRDTKKYSLLFKENIHYGFCRNLFALRSLGIALSLLGFILSSAAGIWCIHLRDPKITPWVCASACGLFLFWWIGTIKGPWVKIPAFAYAERLFESTEKIARSKKEEENVKG